MKLVYNYPLLGSSVDPSKVSTTVKGVLGLIVVVLVGFGVNQADLTGLKNDIVKAVELSLQLFALCVSIFGAGRKIWVKYKK